MLGCVFLLVVFISLELIDRIRPLTPSVVDYILYFRQLILHVGSFARKAPPIIFQILRESEPWQTAVFWWEWIIAPSLMLMAPEDVILIVGIALLSMLIRWILSSKRSDRTARRKLEKRIKLLETFRMLDLKPGSTTRLRSRTIVRGVSGAALNRGGRLSLLLTGQHRSRIRPDLVQNVNEAFMPSPLNFSDSDHPLESLPQQHGK
ncbi:hypothetical protein MSAN_01867900 [Mycena sanguinolenta]|uniref:Transmembrane protein n=1 Tax=Mycena sanguinolenta TaxID=230812 RepID=A0A8H6XU85_9AGAR|nr:hypothetical protein MSAN_01867900 [Mycena sanguinolenta]